MKTLPSSSGMNLAEGQIIMSFTIKMEFQDVNIENLERDAKGLTMEKIYMYEF